MYIKMYDNFRSDICVYKLKKFGTYLYLTSNIIYRRLILAISCKKSIKYVI